MSNPPLRICWLEAMRLSVVIAVSVECTLLAQIHLNRITLRLSHQATLKIVNPTRLFARFIDLSFVLKNRERLAFLSSTTLLDRWDLSPAASHNHISCCLQWPRQQNILKQIWRAPMQHAYFARFSTNSLTQISDETDNYHCGKQALNNRH